MDHLGKYWVIRLIVPELHYLCDGDVKIVRALCCQIAGYIMIYLPLSAATNSSETPPIKKKKGRNFLYLNQTFLSNAKKQWLHI